MASQVDLGTLGLTVNIGEDCQPESVTITSPGGSVVTKPYGTGEFEMHAALRLLVMMTGIAPDPDPDPDPDLLGSHDFAATPAASVDVSVSGASEVVIILDAATAPGDYGIRLSDDGGSTFYATSGDYLATRVDDGTVQLDVTASTMFPWGVVDTPVNQVMQIFGLGTAQSAHAHATGDSMRGTGRGVMVAHTRINLVGPFDAIRFISLSGNMTAGKLLVYKRA